MRRDKPDSSTTRDKPILRMGIEPISSDRKSDILAIIRTERKMCSADEIRTRNHPRDNRVLLPLSYNTELYKIKKASLSEGDAFLYKHLSILID